MFGAIDASQVLTRIADRPWFRPTSRDSDLVARLRLGFVSIAGQEVALSGIKDGGRGLALDRRTEVHLHSLRWADPLRREAKTLESDYARNWLEFVDVWESHLASNDGSWQPFIAAERTRVLALGYWTFSADIDESDRGRLQRTLVMHIARLQSDAAERMSRRGLDVLSASMLEASIIGSISLGASEHLREVRKVLLDSRVLDELGVASTVTLNSQAAVHDRYWELLRDLELGGLCVDDLKYRATQGIAVFLHGTRPDGTTNLGGPPTVSAGRCPPRFSDAFKYVQSQGAQGNAPEDLTFASTAGFVYGRSGWGETERDMNEETFYSLEFAAHDSGDSAQTALSIGYFAAGVPWIINRAVAGDVAEGQPHYKDPISTLILAGREERARHNTVLVRNHHDSDLSDYCITDDRYRPTRWTRRVAYSQKGEYVLVHDHVKSAEMHCGEQRFVLGPGVEIFSVVGNRVVLQSGGRQAVLECLWPRNAVTEIRADSQSKREDQTLSTVLFRFESQKTDVVTLLSKADQPSVLSCALQWVNPGEFVFRIDNLRVREQLVLTPKTSGIAGLDEPNEVAVERIVRRAELGSASNVDDSARRMRVRQIIGEVKEGVWAAGGERSARAVALKELLEFTERERLDGSRDHGLGAAMIDLAADDLTQVVSHHPLVGQLRRTPLIAWTADRILQPAYKLPMQTQRDVPHALKSLMRNGGDTSMIMTVDFGQLVLPTMLVPGSGEVLTVMFHGATDRVRNSMPRFERVRSMTALDSGPCLFIGDPGLDLDASMILSWYAGTESLNLHSEIASYVSGVATTLGATKTVLVGNSGGAFAALQVASYIEGSCVVAFNPQIEIDRYSPRMAVAAHMNAFGRESVADDILLADRMNVMRRFESIDFGRQVFLVQNLGDQHHLEEHFGPFVRAFESSSARNNLRTYTPSLGPGHRVPPPAEYNRLVLEGMQYFAESK